LSTAFVYERKQIFVEEKEGKGRKKAADYCETATKVIVGCWWLVIEWRWRWWWWWWWWTEEEVSSLNIVDSQKNKRPGW
jgi:hypothetical protein